MDIVVVDADDGLRSDERVVSWDVERLDDVVCGVRENDEDDVVGVSLKVTMESPGKR